MPVIKTSSNPQVKPQPSNKPQHVLDRIKPMGFSENDPIQMLIYGRSGTGKTTLWSTFPHPILAIICSGSKRPGELRSIDTPANRKRIKTVNVTSSDEVVTICKFLADNPSAYGTVVLDHASGLQDKILAEILGLQELPAQKSWGMANREEYGQCTMQCKEIIRALLSLTINSVIVAQERENKPDEDPDMINPCISAGLFPKLAEWLHPAVDYSVNTYIRQEERVEQVTVGKKVLETRVKVKGAVEFCLRIGPDPVYVTKFRKPKEVELPPCLVDPTYDKIMTLIRGQ